MKIELIDISDLAKGDRSGHLRNLHALVLNGKSEALNGIKELKRNHPEDYKKIRRTARYVLCSSHLINPNRVKESNQHQGIYEMRGGQARLFFFFDNDQIVICTNLYWKTKGSKREQNRAFERCALLRDAYMDCGGRKGSGK